LLIKKKKEKKSATIDDTGAMGEKIQGSYEKRHHFVIDGRLNWFVPRAVLSSFFYTTDILSLGLQKVCVFRVLPSKAFLPYLLATCICVCMNLKPSASKLYIRRIYLFY
jgi:hypothetical protein